MSTESTPRMAVLTAGADLLARHPLNSVQLSDVAKAADVTLEEVANDYPSIRRLAADVLDHERASMRDVQRRAELEHSPVRRIVAAFRLVGENLAADIVVRAGVRIASESREQFPDRRIDPFQTWQSFVRGQLEEELAAGRRLAIGIERGTWLIVASGMGTKDLIAFSGDWDSAPEMLAQTASDILELVVEFA
ncbi:hypothetical protein [Microbacterium paludicola]|uniref:hypothetical protein n=1 Tax=Microbacterium paludicola TaxID=300019 RepID=UPI00142F424C|nr:hypothetical protein [Microbacterium paludicola]MBF0816244.1 hypothetical protein [Microbacterium paludicola]